MEEEKPISKGRIVAAHVLALIVWPLGSILGALISALMIKSAAILPAAIDLEAPIYTMAALGGIICALGAFDRIAPKQNPDILHAIIIILSLLDAASGFYLGEVNGTLRAITTIAVLLFFRHQEKRILFPVKQLTYGIGVSGLLAILLIGAIALINTGSADNEDAQVFYLPYSNGYEIKVTIPQTAVKVGEEIPILVEHNCHGANVFISTKYRDAGEYSYSYDWQNFYSKFELEGYRAGVVYLQFWYYPYNNKDNGTIYSDVIRIDILDENGQKASSLDFDKMRALLNP